MSDVETCRACGEPASNRHGLPVNTDGAIVNNAFPGQWAGVPSCKGCHDVHKAGGVGALEAHVQATKDLRDTLAAARRDSAKIRAALRDLDNDLGTGE